MKHTNPYTRNGKTLLFTSQDARSLDILEREGRFINKREYIVEHMGDISPLILGCYDWFVNAADKKVKKPEDVDYQIWCSVSAKNCMRPYEGEVAYVLEVPDDEIIYFSALKWDYVLNLHYVPKDEKDFKAYEADIRSKGFKNSYEFITGRYAGVYQNEIDKIKSSWSRVFDIDEWNKFYVQANIWEIKKEWVKYVVYPDSQIPEEFILD